MASNDIVRLNNKQQAKELAEYNERVAEGYDTRYPSAAREKERILQSAMVIRHEWGICDNNPE